MAGLRRTGRILVIALIPWVLTGCASTNSRLTKLQKASSESQEQAWARARLHEHDGQFAEAQRIYAELHNRNPQSADFAHRLGVVCTILGDHDRARSAYNRARELDPKNPELLADMGYASYLQQNYRDAENLLRASLAQQADNARAKSNLALAVGCQGRYDECLTLFREVHGQDEAEILCNLAYVKAQHGDLIEASQLYKQVLAIDPTMTKATAALAQLKSPDGPNASVAQKKPYRKYMQPATTAAKAPVKPATPAKTEVAAVTQAKSTEDSSDATPTGVTWTGNTEVQESAGEPNQLTGWTQEETDLAPTPAPRTFPLEQAGIASVPPETQTVTTDETPFTVVKEAEIAAEPADDAKSPDFEQPKLLHDGWAAAASGVPEQHTAEWAQSRQEQIAARKGQSGFMGFCPVALRDEQRLVDAQPQFTAEYQSQKIACSSAEAAKKFAAEPERYLPAAGGLDVVAVSQGTAVAQGSLEHALWFRHKLYLFMSQENMELFRTQARQFAVQR